MFGLFFVHTSKFCGRPQKFLYIFKNIYAKNKEYDSNLCSFCFTCRQMLKASSKQTLNKYIHGLGILIVLEKFLGTPKPWKFSNF